MLNEFKDFAIKGNVIDMAIGIIIGGAFGKIVSSVVNDVIMPPVGILIGGMDFSNLSIKLKEAVAATATSPAIPAVVMKYGLFINHVIDFAIIASIMFMIIKLMNKIKRQAEEVPVLAEATEEVLLLREMRDLMKEKSESTD
ncbi:MAG: large-conductance mechanosensitive channel protein MscL [Candidatus Kapabacteria bacterium]|nr:large-conductance mechanosensitive channel protein MscL [Candidatus Kapabacteria bacterium]